MVTRIFCDVCKNIYSEKSRVLCNLNNCSNFACPNCKSCSLNHYSQFGSFDELKFLRLVRFRKNCYLCKINSCPHRENQILREINNLKLEENKFIWKEFKKLKLCLII